MRSLRKVFRLRPADLGCIGLSYLLLLRAGWRLFIRRESATSWRVANGCDAPPGRLGPDQWRSAYRTARWINAAARFPLPWARCLQRSLALYIWLDRQAMDPRIRIGVRRDGDALDAHAWVELEGRVINDTDRVGEAFAVLAPAGRANSGQSGPDGGRR